jgi:acetolactate synthase-1/3 small subunit
MNPENFTMSVVLQNKSGALMRVAGLFSKRGYNINTLNVAPLAENVNFSRIILTSCGDSKTKDQIRSQLEKLIDVTEVKII